MNQPLRPTILRFDSLPSGEGLCIVAREQTQGRGRQGRVWVSPVDAGLYFSIVLRPRLDVRAWPLITLMSALAVSDAINAACGLATDIKWPNDIEAAGRKLCGILAETLETETGRACIIGIGINLNDGAFPFELRERATSVQAVTGSAPDRETLLQALTHALAHRYHALHLADGVASTLREWVARSSYASGKRVRVQLANETLEGTTRGLESDGALRVETLAGEIKTIRAGDVTALRAE